MADKTASYKDRYREEDDGLRFQEIVFEGNYVGEEPLRDGIIGDKEVRRRATTDILEKVTRERVLDDTFTVDELNDLNDYLAWNVWDVLAMRATEGVSGMIPRQEYEILAFLHQFYRWPEFIRYTNEQIGAEGVMEIGASAKTEFGTKINCVHDWCLGAVGFGMARCGLLALEAIKPNDYVEESNDILKFMQRVLWGKRQDGYILNSQDRYRATIHTDELLQQVKGQLEELEPGSPKQDAFTRFNAAAELLAFLDHFDCRLGLGDTGPYELEDGKLLIIRDLFTNEDEYHWSDVCEDAGMPHAYTLAVVIDPDAMGLEEIRVNDIATTFTRPKNYIPHIVAGAVFARDRWDTPMGEVRTIPIEQLDAELAKVQEATIKLYRKVSKMSRRELIWAGHDVYYQGMIMPHLRKAGTFDHCVQEFQLKEVDQRVANYYYDIQKRGFAQETAPLKIFSGKGYLRFGPDARQGTSKYSWLY